MQAVYLYGNSVALPDSLARIEGEVLYPVPVPQQPISHIPWPSLAELSTVSQSSQSVGLVAPFCGTSICDHGPFFPGLSRVLGVCSMLLRLLITDIWQLLIHWQWRRPNVWSWTFKKLDSCLGGKKREPNKNIGMSLDYAKEFLQWDNIFFSPTDRKRLADNTNGT